jgi:hypothetical protein
MIGEKLPWGEVLGILPPDPKSSNRSRIARIRCGRCGDICEVRVSDARNRLKSCGCAKKKAFRAKVDRDLARLTLPDRKEYLCQRYRNRMSREDCAKLLKVSVYAIDFLDREERRRILSSFSTGVQKHIRMEVLHNHQPIHIVARDSGISFAEVWILASTAGRVIHLQLTAMVAAAKKAVHLAGQVIAYRKNSDDRSRDIARRPDANATVIEVEKYRNVIQRASLAGHRIRHKDSLGLLMQSELHLDRKRRASGRFAKLHAFVLDFADYVPATAGFWFGAFAAIVEKTVSHRKSSADRYLRQLRATRRMQNQAAAEVWSSALPVAA